MATKEVSVRAAGPGGPGRTNKANAWKALVTLGARRTGYTVQACVALGAWRTGYTVQACVALRAWRAWRALRAASGRKLVVADDVDQHIDGTSQLYNASRPSLANVAVAAFGVGAWPATQFKFDANGRGTSAGYTVRNDEAVGLTTVTLSDTPVAPIGIVQFSFVPHTGTTCVSPPASGHERGPTLSLPARVSNSRQGVIGTNDDAFVEPAAKAVDNPAPPVEQGDHNTNCSPTRVTPRATRLRELGFAFGPVSLEQLRLLTHLSSLPELLGGARPSRSA